MGQGERTGRLYVLIDGSVEVTKDDVVVTDVQNRGRSDGDLAALLDMPRAPRKCAR